MVQSFVHMIRTMLAVLAGKFTAFIIRTFARSGGSAAPGLVALYIDPQLIRTLAKQIPCNVVITGTNGKTTTATMIAQALTQHGTKIIHNGTGSNLLRGIASQLLLQSSWRGKLDEQVGVWEADEAAFVDIISHIKPEHIVLLNLFRDQLDRYGEIDFITRKWKNVLEKSTWKKTLYCNGDDGHVEQFKKNSCTDIKTFGIEDSPVHFEKKAVSKNFDIKARILLTDIDKTEIVFGYNGFGKKIVLPIVGVYNVYNFLAAYLIESQLGLVHDEIEDAISTFKPAFGRMEKIQLKSRDGLIALIKNPAGTTQVIETIKPMIKAKDTLVILLNDNIADGTDVSWIWDAKFESIIDKLLHIYIAGTRRYDMALRLVYAGSDKKTIHVEKNIDDIFAKIDNHESIEGRVFILPTYTALLELQEYLTRKGYKNNHWHTTMQQRVL